MEISERNKDLESQSDGVTTLGARCLGCGNRTTQFRAITGIPGPRHKQTLDNSSDNVSIGSALNNSVTSYLSDPSTVAVLQRNAGLRSLQPHVDPQDPKGSRSTGNLGQTNDKPRRVRPVTSKEPLYRKARLAAQLREIPKVVQVDFRQRNYIMDDDDRSLGEASLGDSSINSSTLSIIQRAAINYPSAYNIGQSNPNPTMKLPQLHSPSLLNA